MRFIGIDNFFKGEVYDKGTVEADGKIDCKIQNNACPIIYRTGIFFSIIGHVELRSICKAICNCYTENACKSLIIFCINIRISHQVKKSIR